jgi:hypothetical protein
MTSRNLKGSRKLQFTGGIISGTSTGGGAVGGTGSAILLDILGLANSAGGGNFTSSSSGSAFVETPSGAAEGSSAAGGTGSNAGEVDGVLGVGTLTFNGNTTTSGIGGFGAGFSPVGFNTVITEVPGTTIPETFAKGGSTGGGVTPPTFTTTITPFLTGPTGGFGTGSGSLQIDSTTTGTLMGDATTVGTGSSDGAGTSFGGGTAIGANLFGSAGGVGSGTSTIAAAGSGNTEMDATNGIFTGTGGATGDFNNQGSGIFGTNGVLTFP